MRGCSNKQAAPVIITEDRAVSSLSTHNGAPNPELSRHVVPASSRSIRWPEASAPRALEPRLLRPLHPWRFCPDEAATPALSSSPLSSGLCRCGLCNLISLFDECLALLPMPHLRPFASPRHRWQTQNTTLTYKRLTLSTRTP
ncbi:hypothetical protein V8C42DRAFT_169967 [Trichoderma barbatum]